MNSYGIANELVSYLSTVNKVGHTNLVLGGAKNSSEAIVVVHNEEWKRGISSRLKDSPTVKLLSFTELENGKLRGNHTALALDNEALRLLLADLVGTIAVLRQGLKDNQQTIQQLDDKIRLAKMILR